MSQDDFRPVSEDDDLDCYNYSLPYAFERIPEVAMALTDF